MAGPDMRQSSFRNTRNLFDMRSSVACVSGDTNCGHKTEEFTPPIAWRSRKRKRSMVFLERTKKTKQKGTVVNQTNIATVSKAMLGKLPGDGVEGIWGFPIAYILP